MSSIKTVGIIGLGSFGKLAVRLLPKSVDTIVYETQVNQLTNNNIATVPLEQVARADVILLTVPLTAYDELLPELAQHIQPETLIIDVCSVKSIPQELIEKNLPDHPNLLITHPLFGPQSTKNGTKGHTLIVAKSNGERATEVLRYCKETLGLTIAHMTASEHDKIMAQIHVLTFFLARGLSEMHLENTPFMTPSYSMITDLIAFNSSHSNELFETIQLGNPYATTIREDLIKTLLEVKDGLESKEGFKF